MKKIFSCLVLLASIISNAQKSKIDKRITDKACECIDKIDPKLKFEIKGDSITSCIQTASVVYQVLDQMLNKDQDNKNIVVANQDFDEIQEYLLENCSSVKHLLMTNDKVGINTVSRNQKAKEFYTKGDEEFSKENYKAAIKNYRKAVEIDPDFAFAWDNMGVSYRKLEQFNEAIECYKKSLAIDPKGHMPLVNIAVAHELLKDFKEACGDYENFKSIYPEDPEGFYGVGRMKYLLNDFETSLDNLLIAYKLYEKTNSPYIQHARQMLSTVFIELKKQKKEDFIKSMEEKHKVNFN